MDLTQSHLTRYTTPLSNSANPNQSQGGKRIRETLSFVFQTFLNRRTPALVGSLNVRLSSIHLI